MTAEPCRESIYFVSGMWCSTCAKSVHEAVSRIDGVTGVDINYVTKLLVVRARPEAHLTLLENSVRANVTRIGFSIKELPAGWVLSFQERLRHECESKISWTLVSVVWFLAMWSSMLAFAGYIGGGLTDRETYLMALASSSFGLPAIVLGILPYAKSGLRAFFYSRLLTLDLFIFLGGVSAIGVSVFSLATGSSLTYADSGSMIVSLLLLTKKIENSAVAASASDLLHQLDLQQSSAHVFKRGNWESAEASQMKTGDLVRIPAGATIPLDGVLKTSGKVNNHLLTGEADAISLKPGDHVLAGAIAVDSLQMEVSASLGGRMIDSWAESALVSGNGKSRYEKYIARIESSLVAAAFSGALVIAGLSYLRTAELGSAIESFFVGILIFCPCLFASIIPLTKQMTRSALMKSGICLRSDDALWDLPSIANFYFDKTGTLQCVESAFVPLKGRAEEFQPYINAIAARSSHITLRGLTSKGETAALTNLTEQPGLGLIARAADGREIMAGRPEFLKSNGYDVSGFDPTYSLVAVDRTIVGYILRKRLYEQKTEAFLKKLMTLLPHAKISILSGDPNLKAGANFVGLDSRISYEGNLSPAAKAERLVNSSIFVGDGLNDTLAFAKARVSFSLGHRAQNFVPADLHLNTPNLDLILTAIQYAKRYRRIVLETAGAAFLYNAFALTLAAFGKFSPLGAVCSMLLSFSTMLVSISRLRKTEAVRS